MGWAWLGTCTSPGRDSHVQPEAWLCLRREAPWAGVQTWGSTPEAYWENELMQTGDTGDRTLGK